LAGISHYNLPAFLIVLLDPYFLEILFCFDAKLFIDFVLNRQPMAIPPESPIDKIALMACIPTDDILFDLILEGILSLLLWFLHIYAHNVGVRSQTVAHHRK